MLTNVYPRFPTKEYLTKESAEENKLPLNRSPKESSQPMLCVDTGALLSILPAIQDA